jgi:predicted exporter
LKVRRAILLGVFALLSVACACYVARSFVLEVDVTHFLVDADEQDVGAVAFRLTNSSQARTLVLGVAAPELETALAASTVWAQELAQHPEVAELRSGSDPAFEQALLDLYYPRRLLFLSPAPERDIPALFSNQGLHEAARRLRAELAAPEGALIKSIAASDPLLAFPTQLRRIEAAQPRTLQLREGRFVAGDPPRAILLLTTVHSPFDTAAQAPMLEFMAKSFEQLDRRFGGKLELTQSGGHRFAVESERRAKADATWLSTISVVLLVVCFYAIYRSTLVLLLSLVPLVFGLLGATALTLALFGSIHALTFAFGGTLIGICTDYPLHLLSHCALRSRGSETRTVVHRLRKPLLLAAGTTATGFLVLASADLPGIREVGVFSTIGVVLALLATLLLLPELIPASIGPTRELAALTAWLRRLTAPSGAARWIALSAAGAAVVTCVVGLPRIRWDDDLFALNVPLRLEWLREDAELRGLVSQSDLDRLVIATAQGDESALLLDGRVSERLRDAQAAGWIEGFRSVQAFVWPRELQERNRRALAAEPRAFERLAEAFEAEGFRSEAFDPFARTLSSEQQPALTLGDLFASPLRAAVTPYRVELEEGRVALLSTLQGVRDGEALAGALRGLPGVHFFEAKRFAADIYARYRARSLRMVAAGALAVVVVLALRYRRSDRICVAAAPALLAAATTLALLSIAGVSLSLLHLLGVLLVLCLGVDYGIFLVESSWGGEEDDAASLLSVAIDCLTTLMSFGLLSVSSFPALSALGISTSLGVCLSLLLVLCFKAVLPMGEGDPGVESR